MGSPYFVHKIVGNVNVVRTERGFVRLFNQVCTSAGYPGVNVESLGHLYYLFDDESEGLDYGSLMPVLRSLVYTFQTAQADQSRVVLFLGAGYEWTGWEKFQRAVVFDLTKQTKKGSQ